MGKQDKWIVRLTQSKCVSHFEQNISYILNNYENHMDKEDLDEFLYEFHERVLGITLGLIEEEGESINDKIELNQDYS